MVGWSGVCIVMVSVWGFGGGWVGVVVGFVSVDSYCEGGW